MAEYLCDFCGHKASEHAPRMSNAERAPCLHPSRGEIFTMTNGGRFVPGPKVLCACEDFESEAADEETAIFREYLKHLETMLKLTLCVCGHSQENHSRDDNINNPDPGEPCSKCDCFTFRPTFYRDGEK